MKKALVMEDEAEALENLALMPNGVQSALRANEVVCLCAANSQ